MLRLYFAALLSVLCMACTTTRTDDSAMPVISIEGGDIQGVLSEDGNTEIYRGIPYAAPPVDSLRWKAPAPVVAWEGVKVCDTFGNAAMQAAHDPNDGNYGTEFFAQDASFSEDCLNLNVWTPRGASGNAEKKLPVAVWVHGGAFTGGWGFATISTACTGTSPTTRDGAWKSKAVPSSPPGERCAMALS